MKNYLDSVTYSDLEALVDVVVKQDGAEKTNEVITISNLLNEMTEFYKQSSMAGTRAFMAEFYEELGEPVPENDAARLAAEGLARIKELVKEVNVLFEKYDFSCRFYLGEDAESEFELLTNQVRRLVLEMIKNGMENYKKQKNKDKKQDGE